MTIKELENRTGMTRANIRYYEGEGLLSPRRLDNGYRDYSEEDARTLEKIKLLRQLQLDIDTIRKVQQGALTLEQVLFVQTTRLEGDKAVIQRAAAVCRDLERSGVEYAALEPRPYLLKLEAPQRPVLPSPPPTPRQEPDNTPRACYHPWQRKFARMLDITLYSTVFDVLWLFPLRDQSLVRAGGILGWLTELAALGFALAVEPLWLHYWGWTPGKWVFGLKLRDENGEKLPLACGWERSWRLFCDGYGLSIPIYGLWRHWKGRKDALEGWDGSWNADYACRYTKEERRVHPAVVCALVAAVSVAALVMGLKYTRTPPNRGPLTVEGFAENYNYYHRFFNTNGGYDHQPTIDGSGRWEAEEQDDGVIISSKTFNGVLVRGSTVWDDPKFTVENGRVTAVTLRWESDHTYLFPSSWKEMLALLALSGSVEGTDLFRYDLSGWMKAAEMFDQWGIRRWTTGACTSASTWSLRAMKTRGSTCSPRTARNSTVKRR